MVVSDRFQVGSLEVEHGIVILPGVVGSWDAPSATPFPTFPHICLLIDF